MTTRTDSEETETTIITCLHSDWAREIANEVDTLVVVVIAHSNSNVSDLANYELPIIDVSKNRLITGCTHCRRVFDETLQERVNGVRADIPFVGTMIIAALGGHQPQLDKIDRFRFEMLKKALSPPLT